MLAHVQSSAVLGIDAYTVHVEVDVSNGLPMMAVVGLPDAAVNESRERGVRRLFVPSANGREAAIVADVDVLPVATLAELVRALAMPETLPPLPHDITMLQAREGRMQ